MIWIAFTLGIIGSMHCIGMCGPLAIAFCDRPEASTQQKLVSAFSYNFGRTITYATVGAIFGMIGSLLWIVDMQKFLSIALGLLMVISFLLSIDLERYIQSTGLMSQGYRSINRQLSAMMQRSQDFHPFVLGMVNGLLPCGLVYLALAGALTSGSPMTAFVFMAAFGLGTFPAMLIIILGYGFFSMKIRALFRRILPAVSLCFGLFLIYRGIAVDLPESLNFWEALQNPIMCH